MSDPAYKGMLECMGKRPVTYIMEKDGNQQRFFLFRTDYNVLVPESFYGAVGQVEGAEAMLEPAVIRTRVYKAREAQLLYVPQSLEPWMRYNVVDQVKWQVDKSVDRIIYDLVLICLINHERNTLSTKV